MRLIFSFASALKVKIEQSYGILNRHKVCPNEFRVKKATEFVYFFLLLLCFAAFRLYLEKSPICGGPDSGFPLLISEEG